MSDKVIDNLTCNVDVAELEDGDKSILRECFKFVSESIKKSQEEKPNCGEEDV